MKENVKKPKPKKIVTVDTTSMAAEVIAKGLQKVIINSQPVNTGAKYDNGKSRLDLIEPEFELEMGNVLTHGAELYGELSWKTIDKPISRYTAALKRHTNAMARGEIIDPSTGLYHTAQIAINAMFLHYFQTPAENK